MTAIRIPARAGPATLAAGSAMPSSAFASPSNSGGVSCTGKADSAGEKNALPAPTTNAAATNSQSPACPSASAAASVPCATQRTRSAVSITRRRPRRSASAPPTSRNTIIGTMFAVNTTPSPVAVPPVPRNAKAIATADIAVPNWDVV